MSRRLEVTAASSPLDWPEWTGALAGCQLGDRVACLHLCPVQSSSGQWARCISGHWPWQSLAANCATAAAAGGGRQGWRPGGSSSLRREEGWGREGGRGGGRGGPSHCLMLTTHDTGIWGQSHRRLKPTDRWLRTRLPQRTAADTWIVRTLDTHCLVTRHPLSGH